LAKENLMAVGAVSAILVALGALAQAGVVVAYDPGTTYSTDGLSSVSTSGAAMAGILVTAYTADGDSETVAWIATGTYVGGAYGTGWSLYLGNDTYGSWWTLTNITTHAITGLLIEGAPGNTVFDVWANTEGTSGSSNGWPFEFKHGPSIPVDIIATYRNQVGVAGDAPVGDLYEEMEIEFTNAGGFPSGVYEWLGFIADTDNATTTPLPAVPEPASAISLAAGLALLGGWGLRRKS